MPSQKSLLVSMTVDRVERAHACRANKKHLLSRGDLRLKMKEGRSHRHYCAACAEAFIKTARAKLAALEAQLGGQRD
jgi:hypothetical protein